MGFRSSPMSPIWLVAAGETCAGASSAGGDPPTCRDQFLSVAGVRRDAGPPRSSRPLPSSSAPGTSIGRTHRSDEALRSPVCRAAGGPCDGQVIEGRWASPPEPPALAVDAPISRASKPAGAGGPSSGVAHGAAGDVTSTDTGESARLYPDKRSAQFRRRARAARSDRSDSQPRRSFASRETEAEACRGAGSASDPFALAERPAHLPLALWETEDEILDLGARVVLDRWLEAWLLLSPEAVSPAR